MSHHRVLIVHPDASARSLLESMLQSQGHEIEEAPDERLAVRMLEHQPFDLIVVGVDPADSESLELLCYARRKHPSAAVILLFPSLPGDKVREALQWGASSVLRFPLPATHLRAAVAQALGMTDLSPSSSSSIFRVPHQSSAENCTEGGNHGGEAGSAQDSGLFHSNGGSGSGTGNSSGNGNENGNGGSHARPVSHSHTSGADRSPGAAVSRPVGEDIHLRHAVELCASISGTRAPVLIVGEPGTGKSLLARTLHQGGSRRNGPFVEVDCSSLRDSQLEIELFGRCTPGGILERPGRLLHASGGTILLNGISSVPPALQFKLLRAIQDGEFECVGSNQTQRLDARFVFTTKDDLVPLVAQGQFRSDLYYRISVVTLNLPPLRHRGEDIIRLAEHFRERFAHESGRTVSGFTNEALDMLRRHSWPGNILELERAVERAVLMSTGPRIDTSNLELKSCEEPRLPRLSPPPRRGSHVASSIVPLKEALEEPERQYILQALEALNWNRQETARVLDINRTTLYKKMKKYGLLFDEPVWVN